MTMIKEEISAVAKELTGTGGGRALAVVLQAVELLKDERGTLDYENNLLAVRALVEAITPARHYSQLFADLKKIEDEIPY